MQPAKCADATWASSLCRRGLGLRDAAQENASILDTATAGNKEVLYLWHGSLLSSIDIHESVAS